MGETIGPQNWQKIQGMVGENLLSRIKAGYTIQIKASKVYQPLKEYVEATEKYSGKVSLGANGELLNYVAGQPFPKTRSQRSADSARNWPGIFSIAGWETTTKPGARSKEGKSCGLPSRRTGRSAARMWFPTFFFQARATH